jgi:hypothetical protein
MYVLYTRIRYKGFFVSMFRALFRDGTEVSG